jgi:phage-related protein
MSEIGELEVKVTADTKSLTDKISRDGERAGNSLGSKIAKGLGAAAAGVGIAAVGFGAIIAKESVEAASNLQETKTKIDAIFGAASGEQIKAWASNASSAIGQSSQTALDAAATFATFGKAAGKSGGDLTGFATELTELSSDLSSFYNTSPEAAIEAIGSALRGENEPIRKYGVLLNDASLKAAYFAKTGEKVTGVLTPQQKVLAAQAAIMEQTSDAQGDFARTSDGLANSQRTLAAVIGDVKAEIGVGLLPAVTEIVQAVGPILKDLAPLLGELAKTVGGTLAEAFTAIKPLLPPLVEALSKISSTVGGALISAIAALIPAVLPLLEIFAGLADRIGPLLSKILMKVAEVLTRVLNAVTPILEPLFDLTFNLLDALWPIIDVVVDALLLLVDALAPILSAVAVLLVPLGEFINVLLASLMPMIKPLIPIIAALAAVFADVLGRAIGVVMAAIGFLIIGFSTIAPVVLNNFVAPVVKLFLAWAEMIVGTAATAFGWIPGLGDKLNTAKDAIGKFKTDSTKAIGDAADMISTEGTRIGTDLVDKGLAAMKDPASANKYTAAGKALGTAATTGVGAAITAGYVPMKAAAVTTAKGVGDGYILGLEICKPEVKTAASELGYQTGAGLAAGVNKANPAVTTAAKSMTENLTNTARKELQVNSPSRVFTEIGGFVVAGLQTGIGNAWGSFTTFWGDKIGGVVNGAKSLLGIASPSKVFMEIGGNVVDGFEIGIEGFDKLPDKLKVPLQKLVDQSNESIQELVDGVKERLDEAKDAFKDYQQEAMNFLSGGMNLGDAWRISTDSEDAMGTAFDELEKEKAALAKAQAKDAASRAKYEAEQATKAPEERRAYEAADLTADFDAVAQAAAAYEAAKTSVKSFEQAWNEQIAQTNLSRTVLTQLSTEIGNTPGGAMLMQQLFSLPQEDALSIATNLLGNPGEPNSLLGQITTDLAAQSVWNGTAATQWANDAKGAGVTQALNAVAGIKAQVKEEQEKLQKIGAQMGDGLVIGFKSKQSAFKAAVRDFVEATRTELGIASPSKVFAQIGSYVGEGFNAGVDGSILPVTPTVNAPSTRLYAPGIGGGISSGGISSTDVKVFIGEKELTDLVDVQINSNDHRQMDLVIAGRRF